MSSFSKPDSDILWYPIGAALALAILALAVGSVNPATAGEIRQNAYDLMPPMDGDFSEGTSSTTLVSYDQVVPGLPEGMLLYESGEKLHVALPYNVPRKAVNHHVRPESFVIESWLPATDQMLYANDNLVYVGLACADSGCTPQDLVLGMFLLDVAKEKAQAGLHPPVRAQEPIIVAVNGNIY